MYFAEFIMNKSCIVIISQNEDGLINCERLNTVFRKIRQATGY